MRNLQTLRRCQLAYDHRDAPEYWEDDHEENDPEYWAEQQADKEE